GEEAGLEEERGGRLPFDALRSGRPAGGRLRRLRESPRPAGPSALPPRPAPVVLGRQTAAGPVASGTSGTTASSGAWVDGSGMRVIIAAARTPRRNVAPQRTRPPTRSRTTLPAQGPSATEMEN